MTKAETKKKQTREQREANDRRRSMVEDSTIVNLSNGFTYDPDERRFFSPNWEVTLNTYDYLREIMDGDTDTFIGCQIVKQEINDNERD